MPPIAASLTKVLSSWSSASLAEVAAAWPGCPVWAKIGGAASSPTATTAVVSEASWSFRKRHLAPSTGAFGPSSLLPKLPMRPPRYPQHPSAVPLSDALSFSFAGSFDKGPKDPPVGLAYLEFGVPLHPETETVARILDSLDDAVLGDGVDDEPRPGRLDRLMMRAVDPEAVHSGDAVKESGRDHPDGMPGLVARIGLAMRQAIRDFVRDMLDQGAAERDIQELLAAADPEYRHVLGERALCGGELEGSAPVLGLDCRVPRRLPE